MKTEAKSNMADLLSVGSFLKKKEEVVYFLYINKSVFFSKKGNTKESTQVVSFYESKR